MTTRILQRHDASTSIALVCFAALALGWPGGSTAEDWPEWRGEGRRGVWECENVIEEFAPEGLDFKWRAPIRGGYSGPAVAEGRVFITDYQRIQANRGVERAVALQADTGAVIWNDEWTTQYRGLNRGVGPRATPTVDGDRVYVLGAMGMLRCLSSATGELIWKLDFVEDLGAELPIWGVCSSPIVDGDRLICFLPGAPKGMVGAFDKFTGEPVWRSLKYVDQIGYSQPVIYDAGGARQLVVWHPESVTALMPETGETIWEAPFKVRSGLTIAQPVIDGDLLFVSSFYNGPMMLQLDSAERRVRPLWRGTSTSETKTEGLHALMTTPVLRDGYIYGICSYGQLRCLDARTGRRLWETTEATEHARWATAFLVRNGERYFINNDQGELIIARLTPEGYEEISRTHLIDPTTPESGVRKSGGPVNWSHPAYADGHIFARNDREIVCASLVKE